MMRYLAVLAVALSVGSGAGIAQSIVPSLDQTGRTGDIARMAKKKAAAQFTLADENKDGKLSREEAARHSRYLDENFDKLDTDKDGFLRWEEFVGHNRWPL